MRAALDRGLSEARLLTQEFVVLLAAHYFEHVEASVQSTKHLPDLSFALCPRMAVMLYT